MKLKKIIEEVQKTYLLFVYGSLKRNEEHHDLLENAKFIGQAKTKRKYSLRNIPEHSPTIGKGKNFVEGELYCVDEKTLKSIDIFEKPYERCLVELDNGLKVLAYYMPDKEND